LNKHFKQPLVKVSPILDIQTITVDYLGANGSLGNQRWLYVSSLDQGITGTSSDAFIIYRLKKLILPPWEVNTGKRRYLRMI